MDDSDTPRQAARPDPVLNEHSPPNDSDGGNWDQMMQLLTPRERAVVQLVADGKTTIEVAAKLGIGPGTVKTHRKNVLRKLRLRCVRGPSGLRNALTQP